MLRIGICDDEVIERNYLTQLVEEYALSHNQKVSITTYESAENFLFEDDMLDLILLDIQMSGITGMDLARKIRSYDSDVPIIFITGVSDYISEGYDVKAQHYLLKPVKKEKLFEVLERAITSLEQVDNSIVLATDNGIKKLKQKDILFVESTGHYVELNCKTDSIRIKQSLSNVEQQLGSSFIKVHRSYLANLEHIKQITKTDIIFDDEQTIPLSRRRYTEINQRFISYHKGGL